uniref:Shieldin complex subunit 2 n=1 Tax=Myripristis murdjan TaxID=586833 RepID=A0A667ZEZ0_9TELE
MTDKPKIHVFLGAPPPATVPASLSAAGAEDEEWPPGGWSSLELCWQGGELKPKAGQAFDSDRYRGSCPEDQCSASIHDYLDSCFPAGQPDPEPDPEPGQEPGREPEPDPELSIQTQYLSTWTLSQALILRGRCGVQSGSSPEKATPPQTPPKHTPTPPPPQTPPKHTPTPPPPQTPPKHTPASPSDSSSTPELFSPVTPTQSPRVTQSGSMELFSEPLLSQRLEEGGVVLEATPDGVLCSQEPGGVEQRESQTAQSSASKSPDHKRPRISESLTRTEASPPPPPPTCANIGLQGPTTPLVRCVEAGLRYSVLVAVVHPCHLKEIKVKSGASAGTFVPLASIIVTDQSGVEMKVVLWRQAAFWALTVYPGDILLITGLQVNQDKWRGETLLQSTYSSRLLNLGQITATTCPPVPQQVNGRSLRSLCAFLRARRPLLVSLPPRPAQNPSRLPYAPLRSLRADTLVHCLLRVTHTHRSAVWREEAESGSRSALVQKAVLTVEQPDGQQGALVLWGAALDWLPRFSRNRAAVWDFRVLLVRQGLTSDLLELHSTPWSSAQPLDPAHRRARDFCRPGTGRAGGAALELDLDTLLSQKYSGEVELRVHVLAFQFQGSPSQNAPQQVLDSSTPPDAVLQALSGDITYTGCGRCAAELDTDDNGIYRPCYPCLPHTAARRYYRAGLLTVAGGGSQLCVQVPPVPLQKILDAPPDKLYKSSAPGSAVRPVQRAADRLQALVSLPRTSWLLTVRSHFLCDENSVPLAQDFLLLDLQFPPDRPRTAGLNRPEPV